MSSSLKHWSWGYLTITIPTLNSASWRQLAQLYLIKLQRLSLSHLKYSSDKDLPSDGMNTFWRGGIQNLEHELEAYELLNSSGEPGESEETIEINRALHEYPTTWTTSKLTTFFIVSPVLLHNPAIHKDTKYRNFSQQSLSRPLTCQDPSIKVTTGQGLTSSDPGYDNAGLHNIPFITEEHIFYH